MDYQTMKAGYLRSWHTWNVRSVLSHVHMPDGLALNVAFKEYANGGYLKETLIGRFPDERARTPIETAFPGMHAFDDSYTEMTVDWCGMRMRVESAVDGDDLLLLVTPERFQVRPAMVVLETGYLWGRAGYTTREGDTIRAHAADGERVIRATGRACDDASIPVQTAFLSAALDAPVAFYTGAERSLSAVKDAVLKARERAKDAGRSFHDRDGIYEAVESAVSWDTIYDPLHDRVISPVSRLWSIGSGGYVLFCWDNFFAGYMASLGRRELAYSNLIEILGEHTGAGFVPNFAYATGQKSADRSQPPVGSAMLLETYRRLGDRWVIDEMLPDLIKWNKWFSENRMEEDGTLCWGSDPIPVLYGNRWETDGVHCAYGAALESGLDNSPMYDDIPFDKDKNRLMLSDVGLTGLYILDCRSLIALAAIAGRRDELPALRARLDKAEAGLETLWDEQNGFYYNRRRDTGEFSRRISPTNFYALFSDRVSPARQRRIADEHYYDPHEFYGEWMLPSISRDDPAYPEQDYWRGRAWAPLNFLVYMALRGTELDDVRRDLAQRSRALFLKEWREHRHVHENYNATTGEGCDAHNSDKFYHWGALLAVIAMAEDGLLPGFGNLREDAFM